MTKKQILSSYCVFIYTQNENNTNGQQGVQAPLKRVTVLVVLGIGKGRKDIQVIKPLDCGVRTFMKKECSPRNRSTAEGLSKSSHICVFSPVGNHLCTWLFICINNMKMHKESEREQSSAAAAQFLCTVLTLCVISFLKKAGENPGISHLLFLSVSQTAS